MKTRVQRWGNSLAVRIPKAYAAEIGLSDGSPVELKVSRGVIVVEPSPAAPRLEDLLRGVTQGNLHREVDTGPSVDNEPWQYRAKVPDRGDVVWISMNPQAGHEQAGRRPAVVLSPAAYNRKVGLAILCPITSQVKGYPFEVLIPDGLSVMGAVLSDQAKSLDWSARRAEFACRLPRETVLQVLLKLGTLLAPAQAAEALRHLARAPLRVLPSVVGRAACKHDLLWREPLPLDRRAAEFEAVGIVC